MYPENMTNDPDRVASDHYIHLPGPTPVRPRRHIAAGVLSLLLALSCFAASPTWAYKAGRGADDTPYNMFTNYDSANAYIAARSKHTNDLYVIIKDKVYRVRDLNARHTPENPLTDDNLPTPVDNDTFGTVAVGRGADTSSNAAISIGVDSAASTTSSVAIGRTSHASGPRSIALGRHSHAEGRFSMALGLWSHAQGVNSIALGHNSRAEGVSSIALGHLSRAQSEDSVAVGRGSTAHGTDAASLGSAAEALGQGATALGSHSQASSYASTAIGYSSWATGLHPAPSGSTAVGVESHATGEKSAALGGYATAAGDHSTAVGQASEAHGDNTVAVGRGAVAGADLSSSDKEETYRYSNVAEYLADTTRTSGVKTVQIGKNVYKVTALNGVTSLTKDNLPGALTTTTGGVAVGFRAVAAGTDSIALGRGASVIGNNGIAIGSGLGVSVGANEVVIGTKARTHRTTIDGTTTTITYPNSTYKLPGLGKDVPSGTTRVVTVDSNGQLSTQSTTAGTASSRGAALRGAAELSSDVTALDRDLGTPAEAADYEKAPAIGSGPTAPATAEQRRVVVQDTNRDGSVRLRTLDLGDLSGLDRRLAGVDQRVTSLSERLNKATAMSSALSALPNVVPGDNRFFLGVGVGHYSSEQALAIGMSARIESRVFVNAGVAVASGDEVSVRGGVGVVW